ncbi:MAG: phage portal protein [Niameybacter sp.]
MRKLNSCIRFWDDIDILTNQSITHIEVYTNNDIRHYMSSDKGTVLVGSEPHHFKIVPINIYYNNEDLVGDFEKIIPLVDGYDKSISDTQNFRDLLNMSYMVFKK